MPHIHEKIDYTADTFIVYNNMVLLRKHDKYKKWFQVGGHVELDETPDVAALREVKEEVGLDVTLIPPRVAPVYEGDYKELIPPWYMNIHPINENHSHIGLVYFAVATTDKLVLEKQDDECKWFTLDELEVNTYGISETVLFYAKAALQAAKLY